MKFRKGRRGLKQAEKARKEVVSVGPSPQTAVAENPSTAVNSDLACPFCGKPVASRRAENKGAVIAGCKSCLNLCLVNPVEHPDEAVALSDWPDLREYEEAGSVLGAVLGELHSAIEKLPVLPEVAQRIMTLIHDPLSDMDSLAKEIQRDPTMSLRLLRVTNSPWYGGRSDVTDLSMACARVGMKGIASVVWSVQSSGLFRTSQRDFSRGMQMLWQHSVVAAYCGQQLADLVPELDRDEAFLAVLQHEIGSAVLVSIIASSDDERIKSIRGSKDRWSEAVARLRGIACIHALEKWKLPRLLGTAIYSSDSPENCPDQRARILAHAVALSKSLASSLGHPSKEGAVWQEPTLHPSGEALGLSAEDIQGIVEKSEDNIDDLISATSLRN